MALRRSLNLHPPDTTTLDPEEGNIMIIFMENIDPPPPLDPQRDAQLLRLRPEAIAVEDHWVRNFIDRLAGIERETKH